MGSRGPHRRARQHYSGTGRITKGRSFGLPCYDWQQLSMLTSQGPAPGNLPHTPLPCKQPLQKDFMSPSKNLHDAGKENCSDWCAPGGQAGGNCSTERPLPTSSLCPAPASLVAPAPPPSQAVEQEPFLLQPSAFKCRRTARLRQQKGTGRATQLRGYRLLLALPPPPPPPPPLKAPSPPPEPVAPDPSVSSPGLLPLPESPHFLTQHSPMEGVPERITPGRPLLPPKTPLSVLPLSISAPGSPLQYSGSTSMYSWPTPMEGVPERSLGLTGQRPPRPKLSPLPPTPVACTPVEGVPEKGEWGRMPQAQGPLQRHNSSSCSSRLARVLLDSRGPTPAATPILGPGGSKSAVRESPHPAAPDKQEAAGDGGAGAQVGASLHPTPWSTATGASLCQAGERRMSTGSPAAGGGDPAGTPAALFAGVGGGVGGGAGGREAGLVAEAAVDAAAAAAVPLGGSGGVAVPVEREPHSRSCHPGSPPQLGAGGAGSAATVGRVREGCAHAGVVQRMPAGSTTPFELVLVGGASGDGGPWGSAAPNTDATGGAAGEDHEDAPAAQPTPARAVDMGAQTGLSLGRPARASSGMTTPAASLRAAGCSLFDGAAGFGGAAAGFLPFDGVAAACSPLVHAHPHQPPRSGLRVRAAAGANRGTHGGGAVALARPDEGACGGASNGDARGGEEWGGWPSCPGTAETIRSLHLEEQHSSGGGDVQERGQGSGLGDGRAGRAGSQRPSADPQAEHMLPCTQAQAAGATEPSFGDVGAMHGSLGSHCCNGQGVEHAAATGMVAEREGGCGSGGGDGGDSMVDDGGDVGGGQGGVGGSHGGEHDEDMDVEQQQQQQQDEEEGGARHYGDDEHDELVGGGRMDELDGQAHAGQQRKSAAPRHPRHQGHGRNSTAQELARQKSLTDAGMVEDDTGLRRSSRPRIKPLEYWRNERKRYGREFKSLPTVLGIETRTPNSQWPALSTGHVQKKSRARTKARTK